MAHYVDDEFVLFVEPGNHGGLLLFLPDGVDAVQVPVRFFV